MADKIPVIVQMPVVKKSYDKKLNKPAAELLLKFLSKAIGKSSKLVVVTKVKKGDKGFEVSVNISDITYDEKKSTLSANADILMSMLPGPKMFAKTANGANADKVKPDKIESYLSDIMEPIGDALGAKAIKAFEGRIDGL